MNIFVFCSKYIVESLLIVRLYCWLVCMDTMDTGQTNPEIKNMIMSIKNNPVWKNNPKPILFNEDDHYSFNNITNHLSISIDNHVSWGYFDGCNSSDASNYFNGYQCPPTDWSINTPRKKSFFENVFNYTL